jgi:hypothetical protein
MAGTGLRVARIAPDAKKILKKRLPEATVFATTSAPAALGFRNHNDERRASGEGGPGVSPVPAGGSGGI